MVPEFNTAYCMWRPAGLHTATSACLDDAPCASSEVLYTHTFKADQCSTAQVALQCTSATEVSSKSIDTAT